MLRRRQPLRAMSRKRMAERAARAEVVRIVRERDRTCQAAALVPEVQCSWPLDVHEIVPRSVWRHGYLEADNCVLICRAHHDWIGANPAAAERLALHRRSTLGSAGDDTQGC